MSRENLGSANRNRIYTFLQSYADGKYARSGIEFDYDSGSYLVMLHSATGSTKPRALSMLTRRMRSDLKIEVDVRPIAGKSNDAVATTIHKALAKILGDRLADVVVSVENSEVLNAILVVNQVGDVPSTGDRKKIRIRIEKLLVHLDLDLDKLSYSILHDDVPSLYQIIRTLYTHAPAMPETLYEKLSSGGYDLPSIQWLRRQLDSLTRNSLVIWNKETGYTLTERGMSTLPRLDHRNSPDIERALALARRKWVR